MICPICNKRKARRFCPAKSESICTVDCATEREVTIDCPSDCPHLVASRQYEGERREVDWSAIPFAKVKISPSVFRNHERLLEVIACAVCGFAAEHRVLVDSDVIAVLQSLGEAYGTLASGIVYENPPAYPIQRELYQAVQTMLEQYKRKERREMVVAHPHADPNGEIRDALVFLTRLAVTRSNGRPKGRAYLDFLRTQFRPETFSKATSDIVLHIS